MPPRRVGESIVDDQQQLRRLYAQHEQTIKAAWTRFSRDQKKVAVLASTPAGADSFLLNKDDSRATLRAARSMVPELNLEDMIASDSYLLDLLKSRAEKPLHDLYPRDAEFISNEMQNNGLRSTNARQNAVVVFIEGSYGQTLESTRGGQRGKSYIDEMLEMGKGWIQPESRGRLVIDRQSAMINGLRTIVESILEESKKLNNRTVTQVPDKLSEQVPPTEHDPRPSGYINQHYSFPAISPSHAAQNQIFIPEPADAPPSQLFSVRMNICTVRDFRFVRIGNNKQMLMFIDGACSNNGLPDAKGGCGVCYTTVHTGSGLSLALERDGTSHTSNRAELRAALLALGMRSWSGEGFNSVVLACDSQYLVTGVTQWVSRWMRNGWKTKRGEAVKNKDLWEMLLSKLQELDQDGVLVQFWLIPREWNEADQYAREGTTLEASDAPIADVALIGSGALG